MMRWSWVGSVVALACGINPIFAQDWTGWRELDVPKFQPDAAVGVNEWSLTGPTLTLGAVEGPADQLFTHLWDAEIVEDGRIVVVEASSYEIRVFGADGEHLTTFGGRGGGPEEFGGPPWISLAGVDLMVWDPGHYRVARYTLDGELLDQTTIRDVVQAAGITPFPNGLVWQTTPSAQLWTGPVQLPVREGLNGRYRRLTRVTPDGSTDLGTYRSGRTYFISSADGGFRGIPDIFAPASPAALAEDGTVAVSDGESADVLLLDTDGEPIRLLKLGIPKRPISRESSRAFRRRLPTIATQLGVSLRQLEEAHAEIPVPDHLPVVADLLWSAEGDLWVGRRAGEWWEIDEYWVFSSDGGYLGRVSLPAEIDAVLYAGADHLVVRRRDQFDVQYLDVWKVVR